MIKNIWHKITQRFPELAEIPIIVRERGQVGYMPQIDEKPWGIFLKEEMEGWYSSQLFIRYFIAERLGLEVESITDEDMTLFLLLHEAGHHQHVLQYAAEGKTGYDWWMDYMNAFWDYEGEVDRQYAISGILPEEYEMQMYREIFFEQYADDYALEKMVVFGLDTQVVA